MPDSVNFSYPPTNIPQQKKPLESRKSSHLTQLAKDTIWHMYRHSEDVLSSPDGIVAKPLGGPLVGTTLATPIGISIFAGSIAGGLGTLSDGAMSGVECTQGAKMAITGHKLIQEAKVESSPEEAKSKRTYGKNILLHGITLAFTAKLAMIDSAATIIRAAADLASQIQPAVFAVAHSIATYTSWISAPIALLLSAWGIKRNVTRLYQVSSKLVVVREELCRLNEMKKVLNVKSFSETSKRYPVLLNELKEREELLIFAERKLRNQRTDHTVGLIANTLIGVGASLMIVGLATGPGALVLGLAGTLLVSVGALGDLLTRSILVALRYHQKKQLKAQDVSVGHYIPTEEMLQRSKNLFEGQYSQDYKIDNRPAHTWTNGELLTFLLMPEKQDPNETRRTFLKGPKFYWTQAFGY